ncbi:MAG: histidine kinase dimerization/phospho-acceptor domain-containing protein, partial [Pirellulaceae bacterium]|nr:histidine kinase dimerization/phospho-acceptor domain-containing protein [Pirellulaceae bacterium]
GLRQDGSTFPMELAVNELLVGGQKTFTGIVRDISFRREVEDALEVQAAQLEVANSEMESKNQMLETAQAELQKAMREVESASAAKSEFLANMSHEIRTPMNAILGYAQILQSDSELSAEQRKAIDTIGESGHHLLELINSILDISKIEAGREELNESDFDLNGLVQGLGMMFEMRCWEK